MGDAHLTAFPVSWGKTANWACRKQAELSCTRWEVKGLGRGISLHLGGRDVAGRSRVQAALWLCYVFPCELWVKAGSCGQEGCGGSGIAPGGRAGGGNDAQHSLTRTRLEDQPVGDVLPLGPNALPQQRKLMQGAGRR